MLVIPPTPVPSPLTTPSAGTGDVVAASTYLPFDNDDALRHSQRPARRLLNDRG
jgi:hypothetical protein